MIEKHNQVVLMAKEEVETVSQQLDNQYNLYGESRLVVVTEQGDPPVNADREAVKSCRRAMGQY